MKTVYTFTTSGGHAVVPLEDLRPASQRYYLDRYPDSTHVVMTPGGVVYAICGSVAEAEGAKAKLEAVTAQ